MVMRMGVSGAALAGTFMTGCANQEQKLGRGINNTLEFTRLGEEWLSAAYALAIPTNTRPFARNRSAARSGGQSPAPSRRAAGG